MGLIDEDLELEQDIEYTTVSVGVLIKQLGRNTGYCCGKGRWVPSHQRDL